MCLGYFGSFKRSSKQAWQNSSYFLFLHCAIYTYNMAAATLNVDNVNAAVVSFAALLVLFSHVLYCNIIREEMMHK